MVGIFGNLFDFNGDGELNIFEQTTELAFLDMLINEEASEAEYAEDEDPSSFTIYTIN